jgi:hypothetical protein
MQAPYSLGCKRLRESDWDAHLHGQSAAPMPSRNRLEVASYPSSSFRGPEERLRAWQEGNTPDRGPGPTPTLRPRTTRARLYRDCRPGSGKMVNQVTERVLSLLEKAEPTSSSNKMGRNFEVNSFPDKMNMKP